MSNLIAQGNATGTGSLTLLAPPTNSTQVLTLPDNTGTLVSTASTGVVSPAMLNGNQSGSAPIYGCRAWCTFNGASTGTNAPISGGNVTSVTRNATGDYTVNFTVAMPDANYCVSGVSAAIPGVSYPTPVSPVSSTSLSTSSARINAIYSSGSAATVYDMPLICVMFIR